MTTATRTWAAPVAGPDGDPQLGCDLPFDLHPVLAHNELLVSGWAVAAVGRIVAVELELAGRTLLASYGHPSPWLRDVFENVENTEFARYELRLDTSELTRGQHELRIRALSSNDRCVEMAGALECEPYRATPWRTSDQVAAIESGTPAVWCESPNLFGEEEVYAPISLRGWAYAGSGIASVVAYVDRQRHEAALGRARPDLRGRLGDAVADAGGFLVPLSGEAARSGRHEVTVIAYPNDGHPVGMSGAVTIGEIAGPWTPKPVMPPDAEELSAERYVPGRDSGTSVEIEHEARYRWASQLASGKRVLDAGCGTGWGSELLARAGAAAVTGIDRSEQAIRHARATHGQHAEFEIADLCSLKLPDCAFDIVVCFETIEHLDDPSSALDHMRRVLAPDGLLLVSTPVAGVYPPGNPFHVHEFAAGELEEALDRRFAHVRALRQRTQAASVLADDVVTACRNPAQPLDLDVRKLDGVLPGEETYTVAAASDVELPPAPGVAVIGDALDVHELRDELVHALAEVDEAQGRARFTEQHLLLARHRLEESEGELAALRQQIDGARHDIAVHEARMAAVRESKSWRFTQPLRTAAKRARAYPDGRKNP